MSVVLELLRGFALVLLSWITGTIKAILPKKIRQKDISKEVVLITGGGSGIGQLMAKRFAELGAVVVVWDVNQAGMDTTARDIASAGGKCYTFKCDVSDRHMVYETAAKVKQEVGIVTILVNNAGIVNGKRFLQLEDEKIIKLMEVNTFAHFWTVKAFLPDMQAKNHGHLVSVASICGLCGGCNVSDYCASKFGAVGFDEALRYELRADGFNIKTTAVCPWVINTGLFAGAHNDFFSLLEPEYVANEIVNGVLADQEILIIPRTFYLLVFLKSFLPAEAAFRLADTLKFTGAMDRFVGRSGTNNNTTDQMNKTKAN